IPVLGCTNEPAIIFQAVILAIEFLETDPVEARQSVIGSKPKVTITGLQDPSDSRVRKSILRLPHSLKEFSVGVFGCSAIQQAQKENGYEQPAAGADYWR